MGAGDAFVFGRDVTLLLSVCHLHSLHHGALPLGFHLSLLLGGALFLALCEGAAALALTLGRRFILEDRVDVFLSHVLEPVSDETASGHLDLVAALDQRCVDRVVPSHVAKFVVRQTPEVTEGTVSGFMEQDKAQLGVG